MKCGSYKLIDDNNFEFVFNRNTIEALLYLVDIEIAWYIWLCSFSYHVLSLGTETRANMAEKHQI